MAVEKKFVKDGYTKASMDEYFATQLGRSGYGGMNMSRTPMGTQITIYAEKPGMVIGKAGKVIRKLTKDVEEMYGIENPQIDAQEVKKCELNAQIMANRLASSIERGWYFRKAGTNTLRAIMGAGALGCEIVISGKLTGARSRVEKFTDGYVKHAGHASEVIVDIGYAVAVKKLGTIGCKVKIVPPAAVLPDSFSMKAAEDVPEAPVAAPVAEEPVSEAPVVETPVADAPAAEPVAEEPAEAVAEDIDVEADVIIVEDSDCAEMRRLVDDVWQHKHDGYDYWHPMARVHKEGKQ